jgi:hypothetical protein
MVAGALHIEGSADQAMGALAHEDGVRRGERLQTRREIRRFADDGLFARNPGADNIADLSLS